MALIGTNGEYLRIETINIDSNYIASVNYRIYANVEHRQTGDTNFLVSRQGHLNSGYLQNRLNDLNADNTISIIDNIKTQAYLSIKEDNFEFSNWIDG